MQVLDTLAHFSSVCFLFKLGVQMDPKILKTSGLKPFVIGLSCFLCSSLSGGVLAHMIGNDFSFETHWGKQDDLKGYDSAFTGARNIIDLFSFVSFPVIAYVLTDLSMLNSNLGRLALHVSMVANLLHFVKQILSIIKTLFFNPDSAASFTKKLSVALVMVAIFIFIFYIVRPAALWMVKNTPEGKPVKESYINLIMISVLLCGLATKYCGLYIMDGAFFLGLAIPDGPPLGATIVDKLDYMITSFLMPLHMGTVGFKTKIFLLNKHHFKFIWRAGLVITASILGKIIGVFVSSLYIGVPIQDSFLLGLIMNLKGIVDISMVDIWIDAGGPKVFIVANTIMVVAMLIIVAVITPLVKYLYDPSAKYLTYKRRSVLQSKENQSDFRVLVCIHTQDDVPNIIRLLEASNPTKNTPLTVYGLHLVELIGRASPLFIVHPRHRITGSSSKPSKSERILNALMQLEDRYHNVVTVQGFTTISPYASMHNDICTMSFDKRTALIIFPFYKQDAISRRDDLDRQNISNRAIKSLLENILRNSPCSVGILIDGSNDQAQSTCFLSDTPYRVVVLFFGGPDDREALAFAMNMIHHPSIFVTLLRFYGATSLSSDAVISCDNEAINVDVERHKFLDDELVDHFRINTMHDETLIYKEVEVKDGAETIWVVRSLNDDFDLMVVGRQQITDSKIISGLNTDLDECEELGVLGDMLSSPDYDAKGSILIIHQRQDISEL
ncbi:hypothetical protein MKW94_012059 [Papaver nudicaule]|uniref:Cation/H+ exchanger domain-containing protein n=1 Tax=Papaver nudicaule TaxID=74823 RepID=A0AA42B312_PAPNU|nr:hypothetical protein [Papaver nudicaule]